MRGQEMTSIENKKKGEGIRSAVAVSFGWSLAILSSLVAGRGRRHPRTTHRCVLFLRVSRKRDKRSFFLNGLPIELPRTVADHIAAGEL